MPAWSHVATKTGHSDVYHAHCAAVQDLRLALGGTGCPVSPFLAVVGDFGKVLPVGFHCQILSIQVPFLNPTRRLGHSSILTGEGQLKRLQ